MSKIVERYQNPSVSDDIKLRLLTYNSNNLADLFEIEKVEIFHLDPTYVTEENPDGLRSVETFSELDVVRESVGTYRLDLNLEELKYVIGNYYDIWTVKVSETMPSHDICQRFQIYPNLWYSTPIPMVYDFDFRFQPTKFRKGSKQFIIIEIIPNVPTAGDLRQYYENLAIVSDLRIFIEQNCGDCVPVEQDLRMIVEDELVDYREKRHGYYKINTEELDCGIYNIWFKLEIGDNTYISDKHNFQVYD